MDVKTTLDSELLHCREQRDAARKDLETAQHVIAQAQQNAQIAQANILKCDGAEAQILALRTLLENAQD